jgi:hypothetical protein
MFGLVKIAGISAVLSAGLVTALDPSSAVERPPVADQKFPDRLPRDGGEGGARWTAKAAGLEAPARATTAAAGKGDLQRVAAADCAAQTWPNIPHGCLTSADGRPVRQAARMITVEDRREGERTSVLVRLPAVDVARR